MRNILLKVLLIIIVLFGFSVYGVGPASPDMAVYAEDVKPPYLGDVNGNGNIEVGDAISVLRYIVNLQTLEGEALQRADVNLDGTIDIGDAIKILRRIVGLIDEFTPVENPVVFTETALKHVLEATNVHTVHLAESIHLGENLFINRDITIENLYLKVPAEGGSIFLSEELGEDTDFTISAVPEDGYRFARWLIDGEESNDEEEMEYTMPAEKQSITAEFEIIPSIYELRIFVEPENWGTTIPTPTGVYEFEEGTEVDIKAEPSPGYELAEWKATAGKFEDVNAPETIFIMPGEDVTITAVFDLRTYRGYIPIASAEELDQIRTPEPQIFGSGNEEYENYYIGGLDKNYMLVNDIDLEDFKAGTGWDPIGTRDDPFTGIFNGEGFDGEKHRHIIKDLTINPPENGEEAAGLFVSIGRNAELKNITLENIDIKGNEYAGGVTGDVQVDGQECAGGLVGINRGTIINCDVAGDVKVAGEKWVGGLTGSNERDGVITNSRVSPGEGEENLISGYGAGGLAGRNIGRIEDSAAKINVEGRFYAGGLVGRNRGDSGVIKDCVATGNVLVTEDSLDFLEDLNIDPLRLYDTAVIPGAGGLVGCNIRSKITGSHATGNVEAFIIGGGFIGWDILGTIVDSYAEGNVNSGFHGGGFSGINAFSEVTGCSAAGDVTVNEPEAKIENSRDDEMVQLLVGGRAGGFAAFNWAEISNCHATGKVEGYEIAGGLIGFNMGSIEACYAGGDVVLKESDNGANAPWGAGGLVGLSGKWEDPVFSLGAGGLVEVSGEEVEEPAGRIRNSYALGSVKGEAYNSEFLTGYGGLVGVLLEDIGMLVEENESAYFVQRVSSYEFGNPTGRWDYVISENDDDVLIKNCFAAGMVDGAGENVGGLVGVALPGNVGLVENSYYDTESTGQEDFDGGEPRSTDEMTYSHGPEVYTGWDFDNTWRKDTEFGFDNTGFNNGYPYLYWQSK